MVTLFAWIVIGFVDFEIVETYFPVSDYYLLFQGGVGREVSNFFVVEVCLIAGCFLEYFCYLLHSLCMPSGLFCIVAKAIVIERER